MEYVFYAKQKGAPEYTCEIIGVETVKPTDKQLVAPNFGATVNM